MTLRTLQTAEDALSAALKTAVEAFSPGSGYVAPFIDWPQVNSTAPVPTPESFVRPHFQPNLGRQASFAGQAENKYRRWGLYIIQVFTPQRDAGVENNRLSEAVVTAYDGKQLSGVTCYDVGFERVGRDNGMLLQNVTVSWQYDTNK